MYSIPEISRRVFPIAEAYGVKRLSMFGSYARGEATLSSDIDLRIVEDGDLHGLIMLARFCRELQDSLNLPVDVLTNDALSPEMLERIKRDEVMIYG